MLRCNWKKVDDKHIECSVCGKIKERAFISENSPIRECVPKGTEVKQPVEIGKVSATVPMTKEDKAAGKKELLDQISLYQQSDIPQVAPEEVARRLAICEACDQLEGSRCRTFCKGCAGNAAPQLAAVIMGVAVVDGKPAPVCGKHLIHSVVVGAE